MADPSRPAPHLGDIVLSEEDDARARSVFEALLADAPDYRMDPFKHPPEVVRRFEELRREKMPATTLPLPPGPRDPYPWTIAVPGGAWYFQERRVVPGLTVATLQAAGIGLSIWSRFEMQAIERRVTSPDYPDKPITAGQDDEGVWPRRYNRLYAVNATAFAVGWAAYLVPIGVETIRWGTAGEARLSVSPASVRVDVQF